MKWVPVTERLPDKEGFYIVKQKGGYVTQLKFRPDVKRKEDDIWTFNILSEWLDESASLPSSSVTGESEAINKAIIEELQSLLSSGVHSEYLPEKINDRISELKGDKSYT